MKHYKYILQIAIFLIVGNLFGQQQPNYTLYRYTMNVINPAYAAWNGETTFTSNIRSQWVNIDNAPETKSFFAATPIADRLGLGVSVVTDEVFIEKTTSFNLDVSYYLPINRDLDLYLGLKAGGRTYNVDVDGLNANLPIDPAIGNVDTGFRPNVGLGAYLVHEKYFVSFSIPSLILSDRIDNDNGRVTIGTDKTHAFLSGGYNFEINRSTELRPSTLVRYVDGAPLSADLTAAIRYLERYEGGITYRTDAAWAAFFLINLTDWIDLGYAYEGTLRTELNNITSGTHEFLVRFNLGRGLFNSY